MAEVAEQPSLPGESRAEAPPVGGAKAGRSLAAFYVALGVVAALALFGGWFWKTWTVWWFDADEAKRRQAQAAARLGLPVETEVALGAGVKMELVLVPAGRFRMGSPAKEKDRSDDEKQHWVTIPRPFYLGKHEVTQEQWEKMMGKSPSYFKGPKNPVEYISWDDCQEFLKKLNALCPSPLSPAPSMGAGLKPAPTADGPGAQSRFRLPTEAEWEWACRAGTQTRFRSGDADESLAEYAWCSANAGNTAHPVGEKEPNAWGLSDMHGNVWEWCADWHGEYESGGWAPQRDPAGPPTGSDRVLRGGALSSPGECRSANRRGENPASRGFGIGFRLVLVPAGP
jgi:formylglycine-generating enzyme required for sulfatase activity